MVNMCCARMMPQTHRSQSQQVGLVPSQSLLYSTRNWGRSWLQPHWRGRCALWYIPYIYNSDFFCADIVFNSNTTHSIHQFWEQSSVYCSVPVGPGWVSTGVHCDSMADKQLLESTKKTLYNLLQRKRLNVWEIGVRTIYVITCVAFNCCIENIYKNL